MALFEQYTKPGVYTREAVEDPGIILFGDLRIPVLIGEGQETTAYKNVELHRGSSAVADDLVVKEDISDQVTGLTREFHTGYFPIVKGDGTGTLTNTPTDLVVLADGVPATVTALSGSTGVFQLHDIYAVGTVLTVTYYFKRMDTLVEGEDLSDQVPAFATWDGDANLPLTLTVPGDSGNSVSLTFVSSTNTSDALAVSGVGTNDIVIELKKANGDIRTYSDVVALIDTGIPTPTGNIALDGSIEAVAGDEMSPVITTLFRNGAGPNTNTTFKVKNVPVVDGSNGGVVTTNPKFFTVKVNGVAATVNTLDGASGLFTLANPVLFGQTLTVTYYTNTYQDTYDLLPASNVATLDLVGFGPDREDFVNTVDYVLEQPEGKNARIQWGASSSTATGTWTTGYEPFDASVITTTLVDQRMWLQACQGTVDGKNAVFQLPDVPTDGSGLSRPTNNPTLVHVYTGTDPIDALASGEVRVIQLFGASKTFKLYNPPQAGDLVYASYYRNILNDHTFTLSVVNPGIIGQGTYKVTDEFGNVIPVVTPGNTSVTEADYAITGTVWPYSLSDLTGSADSPDETITVTFQSGDPDFIVTPATQGVLESTVNVGLRFRSTTTGNNSQSDTSIFFEGSTEKADINAVAVSSEAVTVYILKSGGGTRNFQEIINAFSYIAPATTSAGVVICEPTSGSVVLTTTAVANGMDPAEYLGDGTDAVTSARSLHFRVTSSRTSAEALADGMGKTGGATTPALPNWDGGVGSDNVVGEVGYLNQTYNDLNTGITFTLINPEDALNFGYTSLPSPLYHFQPGDVLTFNVSTTDARSTSAVPTIDLYGLRTKVVSTYGMRAADSAVVNTYNKAGSEPNIGDFYYVSYTVHKTDADYELKIFTNPADAYKLYGDPNPTNKLSLAARLYSQNGAEVFGAIQVKKDIGLETASDQAFMDAISSLAAPLPGSDRKCDMIVPLTTSPVVIQYLNRHLLTQGSQRNSGEAIGIYGYDFYATPDTMRALARSLKAERMIGIAVPGAILEIDIQGKTAEFAVGGEFLAAAMAGMTLNPAIDVATTLTKKSMVGFSRLIKRFDGPTMDLMAADGLTCLVENAGAFVIRHWVTTDNTSPLKREPTSRLIIDYLRRIVRRNLDQFIGRKLLQSAINSVTVVTTSTLKSLIDQEIIEGYKNVIVQRDDYDPTVLHVKFTVKPIFSLLWIDVALTVTTKL